MRDQLINSHLFFAIVVRLTRSIKIDTAFFQSIDALHSAMREFFEFHPTQSIAGNAVESFWIIIRVLPVSRDKAPFPANQNRPGFEFAFLAMMFFRCREDPVIKYCAGHVLVVSKYDDKS